MGRNSLVVISIGALFLLTLAALNSGHVWDLLAALSLLLVVASTLFWWYVKNRVELNKSQQAGDKLWYDHAIQALDLGYLPQEDGSYTKAETLAIAPPTESDPSADGSIGSEVEQFAGLAYDLLLLTAADAKFGPGQTQIMSAHKASSHPPFDDVRKWRGATSWLMIHQHAYQKRKEGKIMGTFTKGHTVGELLKRLPPPDPKSADPQDANAETPETTRNVRKRL